MRPFASALLRKVVLRERFLLVKDRVIKGMLGLDNVDNW